MNQLRESRAPRSTTMTTGKPVRWWLYVVCLIIAAPVKAQQWPSTQIPVCWEPSAIGPELAQERGWIRDAVVQSWEFVSDIWFTGWGECSNDQVRAIRVAIARTGTNRMNVTDDDNPTRTDENPRYRLTVSALDEPINCDRGREFCTRANAVHLFGHALGLTHTFFEDQGHISSCESVVQRARESVRRRQEGASIMMRCNSIWEQRGNLSAGDIRTIRSLYGPYTEETPVIYGAEFHTRIVDHEILDNEREEDIVPFEVRLSESAPSQQVVYRQCVGDEVRAEIYLDITLDLGSGDTRFGLDARLYEGTSCSFRDLESSRDGERTLDMGTRWFTRDELFSDTLVNNERFGGDTFTFAIFNGAFTVPFRGSCIDCQRLAPAAVFAGTDPLRAKAIYNWWNETREDNFATTAQDWSREPGARRLGYTAFRVEGRALLQNNREDSLLPLETWYSEDREEHIMTTNPLWTGDTTGRREGYRFVRDEGFVFAPDTEAPASALPLISWWHPTREDNFSTTDPAWNSPVTWNGHEINGNFERDGYTAYRMEGFILAP